MIKHDFFKLQPVSSIGNVIESLFSDDEIETGFILPQDSLDQIESHEWSLNELEWDDTAAFFIWDAKLLDVFETTLQVFIDKVSGNRWVDSISVYELLHQ